MSSERHLWMARLQVAALIGGGLLITIAAPLPWIGNGIFAQSGIEFIEGKITFALGGVSVLLGSLRIANQSSFARATVAVLGLWLSAAVIMLALAKFAEIRSYENILAFLKVAAEPGLYLTVVGGCIAGAGSVLGLLPRPSDASSADRGAAGPQTALRRTFPHRGQTAS